jgi:hypothetical protein
MRNSGEGQEIQEAHLFRFTQIPGHRSWLLAEKQASGREDQDARLRHLDWRRKDFPSPRSDFCVFAHMLGATYPILGQGGYQIVPE